MKGTQEGCLSRSINKFFEHFLPFDRSKNLLSVSKNRFFDTLGRSKLRPLSYMTRFPPYPFFFRSALAMPKAAP